MLRRVGASVLSPRSLPKGSSPSLPQVVLSLSPLLQVAMCPTLMMFLLIEDGGIRSGIDVDCSGVGTGELCVLKIPLFIDLQVMTLITGRPLELCKVWEVFGRRPPLLFSAASPFSWDTHSTIVRRNSNSMFLIIKM